MMSAGLTIGFVLIQMFHHQGSLTSVQGVLNGLAAQGHGPGEAAYPRELQCSLI